MLAAARDVAAQALGAQQIAAQRHAQQAQVTADRQLLDSARAREKQGVRDARETLDAQALWLQQRDAATQLHAQAVTADLSLIKALGGGYQAPVQADKKSTATVAAGAADHEHH